MDVEGFEYEVLMGAEKTLRNAVCGLIVEVEFAEMYVAGVFADCGWSVYFPRADKGFDFIVIKSIDGVQRIRPVQVKGKYPEKLTGKVAAYGYRGKLTAIHDEMVLAIPFFSSNKRGESPVCIAYVPKNMVQQKSNGTYICAPAKFKDGEPSQRESYQHFFGEDGLKSVGELNWGSASST